MFERSTELGDSIRPKKYIYIYMCVSGFSTPPRFLAQPISFYCVKKYIYIINKKKKMRCGHKTYGSILSLCDRFFFGI